MIQKMSSTLGTFVLNIGEQYTQCWGQLSSMFGTFLIYWIVTFLIINQRFSDKIMRLRKINSFLYKRGK